MKRVKKLAVNLYQKLWITAGLGLFFCSFYFFMAWFSRLTLSQDLFNHLVNRVKEAPGSAVFYALAFSAYVCILVYIVRMAIKAVYLLLHD